MTVEVGPLWSYEITLAPQPRSVAAARRFVREHLDFHDLQTLEEDVILVASELATNAVVHAGTPFTVTITASADTVILSVKDDSSAQPIRGDAEVGDSAGRGLAIVDVVSRDWGMVVDLCVGKSVWAAFDVG